MQRGIKIASHNPIAKICFVEIEVLRKFLVALGAFDVLFDGWQLRWNGGGIVDWLRARYNIRRRSLPWDGENLK